MRRGSLNKSLNRALDSFAYLHGLGGYGCAAGLLLQELIRAVNALSAHQKKKLIKKIKKYVRAAGLFLQEFIRAGNTFSAD